MDTFKIGDRVKTMAGGYTGTITNRTTVLGIIREETWTMKRDDGEPGADDNGGWICHYSTLKLIAPSNKEGMFFD